MASLVRNRVGPTLFWQTLDQRVGDTFTYRGRLLRVISCEPSDGGFLIVVEIAS